MLFELLVQQIRAGFYSIAIISMDSILYYYNTNNNNTNTELSVY